VPMRLLLKRFERPKKIIYHQDELNPNYGRFIAEPFERGYGVTVGNSLRRVLLSSIEGSAITAIKIDGVQHEFSTIKGVLEDVTQIVLNLKRVRLKYYAKEPKVFSVEKKGPGKLLAKDLEVSSDIEIINKDFVIANLAEDGYINMEFQVEKGVGYVPADVMRESIEEVGVIPIDAIFSPIEKVNFRIENTRVGQRTDYERLIIEIWTDGTISPDIALSWAGFLLQHHFSIFVGFKEELEEDIETISEKEEKLREVKQISIEEMELSVRTFNMLRSLDLEKIGDILEKTEEDIAKSRHYSEECLRELKEKLKKYNVTIGMIEKQTLK